MNTISEALNQRINRADGWEMNCLYAVKWILTCVREGKAIKKTREHLSKEHFLIIVTSIMQGTF